MLMLIRVNGNISLLRWIYMFLFQLIRLKQGNLKRKGNLKNNKSADQSQLTLQELRQAGLNVLQSSLCPGFAVWSADFPHLPLKRGAVGEAFKCRGSEGCKNKNTAEIKAIYSDRKPTMSAPSSAPSRRVKRPIGTVSVSVMIKLCCFFSDISA